MTLYSSRGVALQYKKAGSRGFYLTTRTLNLGKAQRLSLQCVVRSKTRGFHHRVSLRSKISHVQPPAFESLGPSRGTPCSCDTKSIDMVHLDACPAPLDACPAPPGCLACSSWSACSAPPRVLALLLMVLSDHIGWGFGVVGV
jgi:hypothetical protein